MFAVFLILEGPAGFEYRGFSAHRGGFPVGVKLKCGIAVEYLSEEIKCLLVGELVGKRNGIGKGYVDIGVHIQLDIKEGRVILKKSLFNVLGGIVQRQGENG